MDKEVRKQLAKKSLEWYGDSEDDCSARWAGLILRAEMMDTNSWWWAVSDTENEELEIDSSNNYEYPCPNGETARMRAELAARAFVEGF